MRSGARARVRRAGARHTCTLCGCRPERWSYVFESSPHRHRAGAGEWEEARVRAACLRQFKRQHAEPTEDPVHLLARGARAGKRMPKVPACSADTIELVVYASFQWAPRDMQVQWRPGAARLRALEYKHTRSSSAGMHWQRALRLCLLACTCWTQARAAGRCPDVSLAAANATSTAYGSSCLEFLRDNGLEHLYLAAASRPVLCENLGPGAGNPDGVTCACRRGTREPYTSYARRTHDANWTGVHTGVPPSVAAQLSCTSECSPQLAAVLESTDARACACWHRAGCALSERLAQVGSAPRQAVLLVPSDLASAPRVVPCEYAYGSSTMRAAAHLLCTRYGIDVHLSAACNYAACSEPGAHCHRADGPLRCRLQCVPGFFREAAATDGLSDLGRCRPCSVCNATQVRTRVCHATFDTVCAEHVQPEPARPLLPPQCPVGMRFDYAYRRCVRCAPGRFWNGTNVCGLCPADSDSARRAIADGCDACEPGTARADAASDAGCEPCPAGTARAANASACTACPPGLASAPGFFACVHCGTGHVPNEEQTDCVPCPQARVPSSDHAQCVPCSAGQHAQAGMCTDCVLAPALRCPAGTYRDDCRLKPADGSCACGCRPCADAPAEHARTLGCTALPLCAGWEWFNTTTRECIPHDWSALVDPRLFVFDPSKQTEAVPLECLDWVAGHADVDAFHLVQPSNASMDNRTLSELAFADTLPREVRALLLQRPGLCHFACAQGYAFATVRGPRTRAWCVQEEPAGEAEDTQCVLDVDPGDFVRVQRWAAGASIL